MIERTLISRAALARQLGVKMATIAKWERTWFPQPIQRVSDRVILYDRNLVEQALRERAERVIRRKELRRT